LHESIIGSVSPAGWPRDRRRRPARRRRDDHGQAWIYAISQDALDPTDPFQLGFAAGDLCG
jgi:proline racemase